MNVELVPAEKLATATELLEKGTGESIKAAIALLLHAKAEFETAPTKCAKNCSAVLNAGIKKLQEDPYMCLEVEASSEANAIKKAYRKIALKYHPGACGSRRRGACARAQRHD